MRRTIRFDELSCEDRQHLCARPYPMFDQLPVKIRRAINNTRHGTSKENLDYYLSLHLAGRLTSSIVTLVKEDDQEMAQKLYRHGALNPECAGNEYIQKGRSR